MSLAKQSALLALGACIAVPGLAQTCPGGTTRVRQVGAFLRGNTVCAVRGGDTWQEYHANANKGNQVIDYKKGPNDPVDPSTAEGTWSFTNGASGTVTYNYTGGQSYTYAICQEGSGSTYTFISTTAGQITGATLKSGQVPCS